MKMIDNETAISFYRILHNIFISDEDHKRKIIKFQSFFHTLLNLLIKDEPQNFSSFFSKTVFILDKYNVPQELASKIKRFRYISSIIHKKENKDFSLSEIKFSLKTLCKTVNLFSEVELPEDLYKIIQKFEQTDLYYYSHKPKKENIPFLRAVLKGKKIYKNNTSTTPEKIFALICESDEYGEFILMLDSNWNDMFKLTWTGSIINIFNVEITNSEKNIFKVKYNALMTLEPDLLYDATELSECFQNKGANKYYYFLKKFVNSSATSEMLLGNIINSLFDDLIYNPDTEFDTAFFQALKYKPLQYFAIASKNKNIKEKLYDNAIAQFQNLKNAIELLKADTYSVEPTFISPEYGIQGRLDLMCEYENETRRKNIVELKSGNSPNLNYTISYEGKIQSIGMWLNHFTQATCYMMLLDSAFEGRIGNTQILYSKDDSKPLRDAPNTFEKKRDILIARNWIVALEKSIMDGNYSLFDSLNLKEQAKQIPNFAIPKLTEFENIYKRASKLEQVYFQKYVSFILHESYYGKIGSPDNQSNRGFASLWQDSLEEKKQSFGIITGLQLLFEDSDFVHLHLIFKRNDDASMVSSFRKGDIAILYPYNENSENSPLKQQIIKGTIKEINSQIIKISLRNKLLSHSIIKDNLYWALEPDHIDSTSKGLQQSLYEFLKADKSKRELLLGLREPIFNDIPNIINNTLNENQLKLLTKALSAKDYFLLQGPPGTGKTSYMLKSIVEYLFFNSNENILLLAYTNRAVDEICSALKRIEPSVEFLRTGSKESSEHTDSLISFISEIMPLDELEKKIFGTRIIVSTVSSVLSNPEILEIKMFDTAIIDEASQILEPQIIGILSKIDKFIMIGDERQLPAVVVQPDLFCGNTGEELNLINLNNLGNSLFERLIKTCKQNEWTDSFEMLVEQARMHRDIQALPNALFYNNDLTIFHGSSWQSSTNQLFSADSDDPIEKAIANKRIIFIESEQESDNKINRNEAKTVANIIQTIKRIYGTEFTEKTVGVISPFRAQCAEIYSNISIELHQWVMVDTVERFQGSERDIIIISFAVNHPYLLSNIQSIVEIDGIQIDRKLNVAMTRARQHLIMLGNRAVLEHSPIFKEMFGFIERSS